MSELLEQLDLVMEGVSKKVIKSYLGTALWSSTDDEGDPLDSEYAIVDISMDTAREAKKDLDSFWKKAGKLLKDEDEEQVAHDFWLTRNGHGAGFWDGDYEKEKGKALTKLSKKFGEVNLYVGDDGKIHS